MVEFTLWSDLQSHGHKNYSRIIGGLNSRLLDAVSVIDQIREYSKEHKIPLSFFLGDLFHHRTQIDISVFSETYKAINRLSEVCEVILLKGNHDMWSRSQNILSTESLSKVATIIDEPTEVEIGGVWFSVCPYIDDIHDLKEALVKFKHHDILLLHAGIDGALVGPLDYQLRSELSPDDVSEWRQVYCGHYHKRQELKNILIVGSPLQVDFGEANDPEKGFIHAIVDKRSTRYTVVPTNRPKFVKVDLTQKGLNILQMQELVDKNANNFCQVIVPSVLFEHAKQSFKNATFVVSDQVVSSRKPLLRMDVTKADSAEDVLKKYIEHQGADPSQIELGLKLLRDSEQL